jgi:hypothetical protein
VICSICLPHTQALQVINVDGHCPRCGADYRAFLRHGDYNTRTQKLIPTGDAHRDRLVKARLALRSEL